MPARTNPTTDIHALLGQVVPLSIDGAFEGGVAGFEPDIGGPRRQIEHAHGMPNHHIEVAIGHVVLVVIIAKHVVADLVGAPYRHHEVRQHQIALIVGGAIELYQRQFDFGVAVGDRAFALICRPKGGIDMVGHATGGIEGYAVTVGAVDGNGGLHQMPGTIHFVQVKVGPALVTPRFAKVRIEVAVAALRRHNVGNHRARNDLQRRRIADDVVRADGLEPFVDV